MPTVLATTSSFGSACPEAKTLLCAAGLELVVNPYGRKLTHAELIELLAEHQPIGLLAGTEPVSAEAIHFAQKFLRVISRVGVGWDNVDHEAARAAGIPVLRTEGVLDDSVAELVLGFMLNALRHISRHDRDLRQGIWKKHLGGLLRGRMVGVVGFGAIGHRVAELAGAFGARIVYSDVQQVKSALGEQRTLPELLREADIVTLHASGSGCIIGPEELKLVNAHVVLVNTARGGMIDEDALAVALTEGRVGCACLDVFEQEPYAGPLTLAPNTILTTHIGSYAAEARAHMERLAVENLLASLGKG